MKKIFGLLLASAVIFGAASCTKETNSSAVPAGQEVEVSFVADLGNLGTRAIADGETVNEVAWAIYEHGEPEPLDGLQGTLVLDNKKATLDTRLVTGKSYDIAFFAYKAVEALEAVKGTVDPVHYEVDWNTKSVTMKLDPKNANDEERDCFWRVREDLFVDGPMNETFILTRPLAQLNIGVSEDDIENARKAGYSVEKSSIAVNTYTEFNLFTGEVSKSTLQYVTFDRADSPVTQADVLNVEGDTTNYKYLATTYLLVNEKTTSKVEASLWAENDDFINKLEYSFVPFQRNYRTNILGNLLTNPATFTIVIDEHFVDDHNVEHWDGKVTVVTPDAEGNYTVAEASELAYIAQLVNGGNDLAGKTVTLSGNIDMCGNAWTPIGNAKTAFAGKFEGAGYTVSNYVVNEAEFAGLFGRVFRKGARASINNVVVKNATINGNHYAGALVGHIYGDVTNCVIDGASVTVVPNSVNNAFDNGDKAGGIAGYVGEGSYKISGNEVNNVTVQAYRDLGGLVGMAQGGVTVSENEGNDITVINDQKTNKYGSNIEWNAGEIVGRKTATTIVENNNVVAVVNIKK